MDASAVIMLLIGAVFLWGGNAVVVANYVRVSRSRRKD
ncbi:MAG TPA: MetS family NSS transporter small subunit [Nocardioidaceae bacterium]|nr:MetS family NSS transporter small subunit [Nocardioidaceae bacterium]